MSGWEETILDIQQAWPLIQQGYVLCLANEHSCYIMGNESTVRVASANAAMMLSSNDFLSLYHTEKFMICQREEFDLEAMKSKDEEYYSWKHK